MDFFTLVVFATAALLVLKFRDERQRIRLLAGHLGKLQIEKLMETLTQGYMRALSETDPERQGMIWRQLESSEQKISEQLARLATDFSRVPEPEARVFKLPVALPYARYALPSATFDMRKALALHAQGVARAASQPPEQSAKGKAYTLSAELFLMQHSCHWYCKSKNVASARMLVRHKTSYAQLVDAVSPETRRAYQALLAGS